MNFLIQDFKLDTLFSYEKRKQSDKTSNQKPKKKK